jgi:fructose-1,6-bisphosphatase/inositol monophosphatase family enzyme
MKIDLQKILQEITIMQREAARIALFPGEHGLSTDLIVKERDFTTAVDRAIENFQKAELKRVLPSAGFLGEETGEESGNLKWVVDPIDGTSLYPRGEYYSNSIALVDGGARKVLLSSVYQPATARQFLRLENEVWISEPVLQRDGKESLIERVPRPSKSVDLKELLGCAFGTSKYYEAVPGLKKRLKGVFRKTRDPVLDREYSLINARPGSGSSALFCCEIADGRRHFAVLYFQKAWDLAGSVPYAREAGCIVECGQNGKLTGCDAEEQIATAGRNTLINVGVFANGTIRDIVLSKFKP